MDHIFVIAVDSLREARLDLALHAAGYQVTRAFGEPATQAALAGDDMPDLVILALASPVGDSLSLLQRLRAAHTRLPMLVLLEQGAPALLARLLDAGADDCVVWPSDVEVVLARVRALLRRRRGTAR
jgi:DNA-binding response OmpR family regulator